MPLATVRFSRVFDVVRMSNRGDQWTDFSFDADIGTRYGARIPGHPVIEPGMQVTAYLDKVDDWTTIVGWRDHATGEVVMPGAASNWVGLLVFSCMALFIMHLLMPGSWAGLLVLALPLQPAVSLFKIRRARQALDCARAHPDGGQD